jgi:hypothetical protein
MYDITVVEDCGDWVRPFDHRNFQFKNKKVTNINRKANMIVHSNHFEYWMSF